MKIAPSAPITNGSYEERATVADIRLCFSYTHTDAPLDGSNNFTRALREHAGMRGIQEWLSFYFKSPMYAPELYPEHDLFIQSRKLKNTLRWMRGEDLITHLGLEYYD